MSPIKSSLKPKKKKERKSPKIDILKYPLVGVEIIGIIPHNIVRMTPHYY
jgi:hypothetical protein